MKTKPMTEIYTLIPNLYCPHCGSKGLWNENACMSSMREGESYICLSCEHGSVISCILNIKEEPDSQFACDITPLKEELNQQKKQT